MIISCLFILVSVAPAFLVLLSLFCSCKFNNSVNIRGTYMRGTGLGL